jgi:hypothetical protein
MRGHQQIIDYRTEGFKPVAVFLEAGFEALPPRFDFEEPERALDHGFFATVTIEPTDTQPDLRFLAGCRVHIAAPAWTDAVTTLAEQCAAAGAVHIIVCCIRENGDILEYKNGDWHASSDR